MTDPTDAELMARTRHGDREAFGLLVDRHKDKMVNYLTRLTGCRERAEETAQETFLRLYRTASSYTEKGKLTSYAYRIATNLVRQQERKDRRWRLLASMFAATNGSGSNGHRPSPQASLLQQELQQALARALSRLPITFRVPVILRDIQGWPYSSIAQVTGCREGTIKSRINRGRQQLRHSLAAYKNRGASRD